MKKDSRKGGVMSVELAMQREMAYRKRLESSQAKQGVKTKKGPPVLHNETSVPTSTSGPRLTVEASANPTPSSWFKPSPSPCPYPISKRVPGPSSLKTQGTCLPQGRMASTNPTPSSWFKPSLRPPSPSLSPNQIPKRVPGPSPLKIAGPRLLTKPVLPSGSYHIGLGPTTVSIPRQRPNPVPVHSSLPLNPPQGPSIPLNPFSYPGPSCQQRLQITPKFTANPYLTPRLELSLNQSQKRKETPNQQLQPDIGGKRSKVFCGLCGITCSSPENLQMHLRGQKHKAKANRFQEFKTGKTSCPIEVNDPQVCCELCGVWCMNQFSYQEHLSGKNHIVKLHAAQNK